MYPSNPQQGGGATTPQGYYTAQGFPAGMGMMSPQQPPGQQQQQPGQPQIIYQSPMDQPSSSSHQGVPVLYQSQMHQGGGAPPHYGPTLASPGDVPRSTSPSAQPIHGMPMTVVGQQQQQQQQQHQQQQLLSQGPGMLGNQRPQSPQIMGPGVSYPQSVPSTGPGSTGGGGPGLLSQMGYNPLQQRRGLSLEQHGVRPRDLFAPGMSGMLPQGIHSPGTSPSQSPGPPLQRPGIQDKGTTHHFLF